MTASPRLSIATQVGYATAESGINLVETMLRLYLLVFYTGQVGLSAELASSAAALAIVWDAVTDPVMGAISDRTRHRFGGRRGYLPAGGVLLGLGIVSVFFPPALADQSAKFWWLLGSYCFLNTGMTVLSVPYMAMAGELTEDPKQRNVLFGARFAFANIGAFLAAGLPMLLRGGDKTDAAMPRVAAMAAIIVVVTALLSWRATRDVRMIDVTLPRQSLIAAFLAPFSSRTFRPLLAAYVLAYLGIGVNAVTFVLYYRHVLRFDEADQQTVLAVFLAMFTASLIAWVKLANVYGKRWPLVIGALVLGVGTSSLYLAAPSGQFWFVLVVGGVGLGAFAGSVVLIDALLTDVIDHDLLMRRQLRSGLFFGVWRFASKMARAVSLWGVGLVLEHAGFLPKSDEQPESVHRALVLLFGPGVGGFFLAAGLVLLLYRFRAHQQERVRVLLARRERAR